MKKLNIMLNRAAGGTIAITGSDSAFLAVIAKLAITSEPGWTPARETEDFLLIQPSGGNIGIDEIARTGPFLLHRPDNNRRKYIVVNDVDRLTTEAANSFLKVLEEPPDFVTVILTSSSWNAVLTTIRSRAMELRVSYPVEALKDLKLMYREGARQIYAGCYESFRILKYCLDNDIEDLIKELREYEDLDLGALTELLADLTQEDETTALKRRKIYTVMLKRVVEGSWGKYFDSFLKISWAFGSSVYFERNREFASVLRSVLRDFLIVFTTYNWNLVVNIDLTEWLSEFNAPNFDIDDYRWCERVLRLKTANLNNKLLLHRLLGIAVKTFADAGKTEGRYA